MAGGVAASSSDDEQTDEKKEYWPTWKLMIIALPQLGVQVLWMFLGPNTTPYLMSLGATAEFATANNSAGPVIGFIVGPIVGTWSDQSTSRWGRRRPIIVAGFLATLIAGFLYSGAGQVMSALGYDPKEGKGAMYLAASMQWVVYFTINVMQTPFRALVSDLSSPDQQMPMQIFFCVVCAIGGFFAFFIMGIYEKTIDHMMELTCIVLLINAVAVAIMLSVARETPFVPKDNKKKSACDPVIQMMGAVKGRPNVFYLLIFVQCCVWLGNSVWGVYGKEYFTKSVYEGNQTALENTTGYDEYVAGNAAFSKGGMIGSAFNLLLALGIMALGYTKIPTHLYYAPCVLVGSVVCFFCAFVVGHSHSMAMLMFILSRVPLAASNSIPYGIVAVWNKAEERMTGKVGSVALQMAILNCCITVGQQLCTMILAGFEGSGQHVQEAIRNLFIISMVANGLGGICTFFLGGGPQLDESSGEASESEAFSED